VSTPLVRAALVAALALACSPAQTDATAATPSKHPALDEEAAARTVKALALVEPDARHVLAVNGLLELERGRVGGEVLDALEAFVKAPLDMRAMKIAAGLDSAAARAGWKQACKTSFDDFMRKAAALSPADRWTSLRGACESARFEQLGVAPAAKVDGMAVILALVTYGAIERGASVSEAERTLLAALAAAPDPEAAVPAPAP